MEEKLIFQQVAEERLQRHSTRKPLYDKLEEAFDGATIVSLFTSFVYPVMLEDADADMLEGILRKSELSNGLILISAGLVPRRLRRKWKRAFTTTRYRAACGAEVHY